MFEIHGVIKAALRDHIDGPAQDMLQFLRDAGECEKSGGGAVGCIYDHIDIAAFIGLIARDRAEKVGVRHPKRG